MLPGSHFGRQDYWQAAYATGHTAQEWFLSAGTAARSTADAVRSYAPAQAEPLRVAHLGCGASTLGAQIASTLQERGCQVNMVLNLDCALAALSVCEAHQSLLPGGSLQQYSLWDAADAALPGDYDILLDKGTLDALSLIHI